jgi:hypothetical protein
LTLFFEHLSDSGVYILENTPLPQGGKYQPMSFGGKMKSRIQKAGKCKRKRKKGERKIKKE